MTVALILGMQYIAYVPVGISHVCNCKEGIALVFAILIKFKLDCSIRVHMLMAPFSVTS